MKISDIDSLFLAHKIHFHNGSLEQNTSTANVQVSSYQSSALHWHLSDWADVQKNASIDSQIKKRIRKQIKKYILCPEQEIDQKPIDFDSTILPYMGYVLFVPKATNQAGFLQSATLKAFPSYKVHKGQALKKTALHIHLSFDKNFLPSDNIDQKSTGDIFDKVFRADALPQKPISSIKNFIFLEEGTELTLIESFNLPKDLKNPLRSTTYVQCEPHSSLHWLNVNQGPASSSLFCETHCKIKYKASLNRLNLSLSEGISKDFVTVQNVQAKSRSVLLGLALLKQKADREQRWETYLREPEAYARQYFKGILNDKARNVFHGKVGISSQSVNADCAQSAQSLLLSDQARSHINPEMEVHCGEVKAKHGATTTQLNKEELFYLQSRGLLEAEAFEMLMMSHIKSLLSFFPEKHIMDKLLTDIQKNKKKYLNILTKPMPSA